MRQWPVRSKPSTKRKGLSIEVGSSSAKEFKSARAPSSTGMDKVTWPCATLRCPRPVESKVVLL